MQKRSNGSQNARPVRALHGWRPPALGHRVREALVAPLAAAELSRLRVIAQTCELRIARDVLAYSYKDFATKSATEIAVAEINKRYEETERQAKSGTD